MDTENTNFHKAREKTSINYYLKTEDAEGLQFKEELAKILKGS